MRLITVAGAIGAAVAVPLMLAAPAHADMSGYRRCVGNIAQLPRSEPEPKSAQLAGWIEQDLKSGVSPEAESQKLAQHGFDPHSADVIVHCVMEENP